MRFPTLVLASALAVAALTGGCAEPSPSPVNGPTEAVSTVAVPDGMGSYGYDAPRLTVTFTNPDHGEATQGLAHVTDALADLPVTFTAATTSGGQPQLVLTWTAPAQPGQLDTARAAVTAADAQTAVTADTVHLVAVKFTAQLPKAPDKTFPTTAARELSGHVPGRYNVTVSGSQVTVVWAAPGLTATGVKQIRDALAALAGIPGSAVTAGPVG